MRAYCSQPGSYTTLMHLTLFQAQCTPAHWWFAYVTQSPTLPLLLSLKLNCLNISFHKQASTSLHI